MAGSPFRPSISGIASAAQAEARRSVTRALSHTIHSLVIEMLDTRLRRDDLGARSRPFGLRPVVAGDGATVRCHGRAASRRCTSCRARRHPARDARWWRRRRRRWSAAARTRQLLLGNSPRSDRRGGTGPARLGAVRVRGASLSSARTARQVCTAPCRSARSPGVPGPSSSPGPISRRRR